MTCLSTEELAGLYDGTLPAKRAARVRSHLAHCGRCVHELRCLHRILQVPSASTLPPEDLARRALERHAAGRLEGPRRSKPRLRTQLLRK